MFFPQVYELGWVFILFIYFCFFSCDNIIEELKQEKVNVWFAYFLCMENPMAWCNQ